MKAKRILSVLLAVVFMFSFMNISVMAEDTTSVVTINSKNYATFDEAIKAANEMTGEVTIEICGKVVTNGFSINNPQISKLSFVGKGTNAEICVDGVSYIDVRYTNYPIEYTELILSHINAGQNIDGFLPQYFSTYNGGDVTYNKCEFPNGVTACGSVAGTTYKFNECIFNNTTSGLYSLWVYGNSTNVVVNGGEFCGVRGIKLYSEGSDDFSSLSVSNATFTESVTQKPAIVLTYGESVTLENNKYSSTGVFELDKDGAPNGTPVKADINDIACMNDDYTDCGVLVDGKIYTTITDAAAVATSGSTVTLMYDTTETVELAEGVTLNTNNYTAENVTVVTPAATGTVTQAYTKEEDGYVRVWGEGGGNASESYELKLYSEETLIATTELNNVGGIIDGDVYVTWHFFYPESSDEYWTTTWEEGHPNSAAQPTKVVLYIDGQAVAENVVKMNAPDDFNPVVWRKLGGVAVADLAGSGSAEDPYLIENLDELKWFRDDVNNDNNGNNGNDYDKKYVKLTADIDLNDEEWTPIGYKGTTFKGNFDGGNHTIKNLKITKTTTNSSENNGIGFFGRTDSPATITNLTIENVDITGSLYVGAIVGHGYTGNKVENCTVKGDIAIDAWWYAGVIGGNGYMNLVNNCHVIGNTNSYIKGNAGSYIGGIWGFRGEGANDITNCTVKNLSIEGVDRVGGICGIGHYGNTISNCTAKNVTITATDSDATTVGLIVGACQGTTSEPTTFTENTVEETTAKVGDKEITSLYGTKIDGSTPVTNYVAEVNGTQHATLADAVAAADDGDTVTLLANTTESAEITLTKNVTIDLASKTVTIPRIMIKSGAKVEIMNGTIVGSNEDNDTIRSEGNSDLTLTNTNVSGLRHTVRIVSGNATINGGTYSYSGSKNVNKTLHIINIGDDEAPATNVANVTINDGTFIAGKPYVLDGSYAVCVQKGSTATINGGNFKNGFPNLLLKADEPDALTVKGGTYDWDPTKYVATGYSAIKDLNGNYVVGTTPTATVNNLGKMTIAESDYIVLEGARSGDMPLNFVMQFLADQTEEDMKTSPYADWYGDFVITITGLENGSFTADEDTYLAGYYGDFGWVKVPIKDMVIEDGVRYPVMLGVGMGQKYDYICSSVSDFRCAMNISNDILEANPNLKVNLELSLVDNSKGESAAAEALISSTDIYKVESIEYTAEDFEITETTELFDIYGTTMTLGNSLAVNFYVESADLDGTDYYAVIERTYADGRKTSVNIPYSEWRTNGIYKVFAYNDVAAKEMGDDISVQIFKNDGTSASNVYDESIENYALRALAYTDDNALKVAMVDMLNYGASAQTHFGYNVSNLVSSNLTDTQKGYATKEALIKNTNNSFESTEEFVGNTLTLENNIILNFYFDTTITNNMSAVIAYTDHYGTAKTINMSGDEFGYNSGYIYVPVDDLVIADGYQVVTCTIYDGTEVVASAQGSVDAYVEAAMKAYPNDTLYPNLIKFVKSAYNLFHPDQNK